MLPLPLRPRELPPLARELPPPDRELLPLDRELLALARELPDRWLAALFRVPEEREAPLEDPDALAVLLFEVFALWARVPVVLGLRCVAFADLDDERLEVFARLGEPRSLSADITTSYSFPPHSEHFETLREQVFSEAYPLRLARERRQRMSQSARHGSGRMF